METPMTPALSADPREPCVFAPMLPHASPPFQTPGRARPQGLHAVVNKDSPASAAKLTVEGLEHWQVRLSRELAQLDVDIECTAVLPDKWCYKCGVGLDELKELRARKERDLGAIVRTISEIDEHVQTVIGAALQPCRPTLMAPPSRHPSAPRHHYAAIDIPRHSPVKNVAPLTNARTLSQSVARKSAILVNSPDISKRLIF